MSYNTITKQSIASHLNIPVSSIISIATWANSLYVHIKGIGYRFVTKKIAIEPIEEMNYYEYDRAILSAQEQVVIALNQLAYSIADSGSVAGTVDLHKAVLVSMEINLNKLNLDFNSKY